MKQKYTNSLSRNPPKLPCHRPKTCKRIGQKESCTRDCTLSQCQPFILLVSFDTANRVAQMFPNEAITGQRYPQIEKHPWQKIKGTREKRKLKRNCRFTKSSIISNFPVYIITNILLREAIRKKKKKFTFR